MSTPRESLGSHCNGFPFCLARKPFKYQEDAPDGGLMDFLEGKMPIVVLG